MNDAGAVLVQRRLDAAMDDARSAAPAPRRRGRCTAGAALVGDGSITVSAFVVRYEAARRRRWTPCIDMRDAAGDG